MNGGEGAQTVRPSGQHSGYSSSGGGSLGGKILKLGAIALLVLGASYAGLRYGGRDVGELQEKINEQDKKIVALTSERDACSTEKKACETAKTDLDAKLTACNDEMTKPELIKEWKKVRVTEMYRSHCRPKKLPDTIEGIRYEIEVMRSIGRYNAAGIHLKRRCRYKPKLIHDCTLIKMDPASIDTETLKLESYFGDNARQCNGYNGGRKKRSEQELGKKPDPGEDSRDDIDPGTQDLTNLLGGRRPATELQEGFR